MEKQPYAQRIPLLGISQGSGLDLRQDLVGGLLAHAPRMPRVDHHLAFHLGGPAQQLGDGARVTCIVFVLVPAVARRVETA